ncbi:hypothetical protein WR25_05117 [Diploscapter pachys]|uniref:Uncharacterized protein n=1 Tax=Diploscapter pachys TaxID=2018661 RepID=A0A2A2KIJ8_9BILA|nr:hypothetical protein WR25_05117 [Diploscapter pachys]
MLVSACVLAIAFLIPTLRHTKQKAHTTKPLSNTAHLQGTCLFIHKSPVPAPDTAPGAAQQQAVAQQAGFDLFEGAQETWIVGRQKTGQGDLQQARVQLGRAVGLNEVTPVGIQPATADLVTDLVRHLAVICNCSDAALPTRTGCECS